MTKILIEIDTDIQRVVPVFISEEMHIAAAKVLMRATGIDGTPQRMLDAICAAVAPQPEPVDVDMRRDAERLNWLLEHPDAMVCSDGSYGPFHIWFQYSNKLVGYGSKTAREAIDAAMSQGEQK